MNELPKDRLRKAMEDATGLSSATDVWTAHRKALGVGKDLFISNLNGNRDISRRSAAYYGKVFGVTPGWILFGDSADAEARPERSQLEGVSALAAALDDADARALYERLSARIQGSTPQKSSPDQKAKTSTKAKSGQHTHS